MNAPALHHPVAEFQLRHFADADGLLFHFGERRTNKGIRHDGPKGVFREKHLYSTIDFATGALDPSLEHFFDRNVENPAAPIIAKIVTAARAGKAPDLTPKQKAHLDLFMQYQSRRVPELTRKYMPRFEAALDATLAGVERDYGPLPQDVKDEFTSAAGRAVLSRNAIAYAQGRASPDIAAAQRRRGLLVVLIADPKKAFIIGSNPIVPFQTPSFREFGVHGYWLPIASDVAICLGGQPGKEDVRQIVDHRGVRRLNELAWEQSDKIAGRSRELVASIVRRR